MFRPTTIRVGDPDEPSLRARHAAVEVRRNGATVQLACTADARAFIQSKLGGDDPAGDEARFWSVGSSFEADLLCASLSRQRMPSLHAQGAQRAGVCWLSLDLAEPGLGWRVAEQPMTSGGWRSVGPFLDRGSASRWSAMLDARFELCRYPAELRKAPNGTPCSYKQMGLCPAACDGSEPMHNYLSRAREALAFDAAALEKLRLDLSEAVEAASGAHDFEQAARWRDELRSLPKAVKLGPVGPAARFGFLAVCRGERAGWVRLMALGLGGWSWVGDVRASACDEPAAELLIEAGVRSDAGGDDAWVTGLIAREAVRPRRGGPQMLAVDSLDGSALLSAVRRVAKIHDA